ncbi:hypothetical protein C1N80_06110 [Brachybacterium sp. SGAir0954]|uniref:hypothetical protein n=1 Tax=Brachybacterium sp. SGAir0954 TaxID=2571029 RepID=UPI0010CCF11A|nr:hypothetical protein [Brachybacterium sp. SGAir0954]QCR53194.1 hypothetical protein C1N80_06110 [Brachybacterium sp. SGAir0954]
MARHFAKSFERVVRIAAYVALLISGIGVLVWTPQSYEGISLAFTYAWGIFQVLGGGVALIALLARRVLWEWRVVLVAALGVGFYAGLSWVQVLTEAAVHTARAGDITALFLLLVARWAMLWVKVEEAEAVERARNLSERDEEV